MHTPQHLVKADQSRKRLEAHVGSKQVTRKEPSETTSSSTSTTGESSSSDSESCSKVNANKRSCDEGKLPEDSAESDSADDEAGSDDNDDELKVMTDVSDFEWFRIVKVHIVAYWMDKLPIPLCRELLGTPFVTAPRSKGIGWTDEIETKGLCPACAKSWDLPTEAAGG